MREAMAKIEALIVEITAPDAYWNGIREGYKRSLDILRSVEGAWVDVRIDKTQPLSCGNCHLQDSSLACVVLGYDRTWGLEDGEKLPRCPAVIL